MAMSIGLFTYNTTAFAQQDDLGGMGGLGDEMALFQEIPSVFGASKYEQKVTDAPSSISIVTSDEIKKYGYRTLADILRSQRGFYVTSDRSYSYLGVRGFNRPGDHNTRILLLVDGHRINDNIYSTAYIGEEFSLDIDIIDRVEVIRGPSSSIYGTNAFFGVINVITKRGRYYKGTELSGVAGDHDTYKGGFVYGNKFPGEWEVMFSGSGYDANGEDWYYAEFENTNLGIANNGVATGLDWERKHSAFLKASNGPLTLTANYGRRDDAYPTAPWETAFNPPSARTIDERAYIDLNIEKTLENQVALVGRLYYDHYSFKGEYTSDNFDTTPALDMHIDTKNGDGKWYGAELHLSKTFLANLLIVAGGEYINNAKQDQVYTKAAFEPAPTTLLEVYQNSTLWALFCQTELKLNDKWIINAGVRYDDYQTFGNTTNPRAAIIFKPITNTTFKALYGTAFRAPNAYELYFDDGTSQKGNLNIKPETIDTYELIWEQYIGKGFQTTLSGFYYEIKNLITQETDIADTMLVYNNCGFVVESIGLEAGFEGKFKNGIESRLTYTYQKTTAQPIGMALTNSPKNMAKLNLIFPLFGEKIFLGVEEQYVDTRKTISGNSVSDYTITNLTVFSKNLVDNMELSASVYNLFNNNYSDPGSAEHTQDAIEQDGMKFRIKLTYTF